MEIPTLETEIPSLETTPASDSHLVPALCWWRAWKTPQPSAWADELAPCL